VGRARSDTNLAKMLIESVDRLKMKSTKSFSAFTKRTRFNFVSINNFCGVSLGAIYGPRIDPSLFVGGLR
jgi:hypothetical protein